MPHYMFRIIDQNGQAQSLSREYNSDETAQTRARLHLRASRREGVTEVQVHRLEYDEDFIRLVPLSPGLDAGR